jgi:hypothetical protein
MMGKRFECFAKLWFFVSEEVGVGGGECQIVRMRDSEAEIK